MTINELKEYIYNENKIEYILEQLGCHEIKYNEQREYWSATQPDGDNPMGVVIRNNQYLSYRSFSRGVNYEDGKDLISLVEITKKMSFIESVKYLHKILELSFEFKKKEEKSKKKYDPLSVFKKVLRCNRRVIDVADIQILEDKLLNDFVPMLHISWLKQGITERTRKKFGLCYSYRHKRVIIPMKYWATGELLGFNQRTVVENYKEFGIKKYFITPTYPKQLNLYGLYENYDYIQKAGYVVVAESEKSVLKRDSLGDSTVVALSGKSISDEQVRVLIGLNVEVVIALDNDVDVNEVRFMCEKFKNIRKVSYIKDFMGFLDEKDAPMDARNKNYQFLFDNRIVYDREEQRKYQESLKK
jgi:DNA primase